MPDVYSELNSMLDELEYLENMKESYEKQEFLSTVKEKRAAGYSLIQLSNSLVDVSEALLEQNNVKVPTTPSGNTSMNGCIEKLGEETDIIEKSLADELLERTEFRGGASHVSADDVNYDYIYEELQDIEIYRRFITEVRENIE